MGSGASIRTAPREDTKKHSKQIKAWSFWDTILNIRHDFPDITHIYGLSEGGVRTVVILLKLGNFTNHIDSSVCSHTFETLKYLLLDVAQEHDKQRLLQILYERVTRFVTATIDILGTWANKKRMLQKLGCPPHRIKNLRQSELMAVLGGGFGYMVCINTDWENILLKALKALVGNHTWFFHGSQSTQHKVFKHVQSEAKKQLESIASYGEDHIFSKIRGTFSTMTIPPRGKHRLDNPGILPYAKTLKIPLNAEIAGIQPVPDDMEFLVILQYFALLVDPFFQARAKKIAENHNDGDWKSCWRAPPTKTWVRMLAKMKNPNDHGKECAPKAAANIDMSRCALTFKSADCLKSAFESCCKNDYMDMLRVKNNFADTFNATKETFGYRSIMANILVRLPGTWGDIIEDDKSGFFPNIFSVGDRVIIERYAKKESDYGYLVEFKGGSVYVETEAESVDSYYSDSEASTEIIKLDPTKLVELNDPHFRQCIKKWKNDIPQSLKSLRGLDKIITRLQFTLFLNQALLSSRANFIVEIQFLLQEYLNMRKDSHIWSVCCNNSILSHICSGIRSSSNCSNSFHCTSEWHL